MTPLVSVVTPTWQRHDVLLDRCIPSVAAQAYRNVEHIVVSDGPDPVLFTDPRWPTDPSVRGYELDHHDDTARWGHWARQAGIDQAKGDLIAYLDDDNAYRPDHLERLVAALAAHPEADFAYSRMVVHVGSTTYEVGTDPPVYGQVDTSLLLHRPGLLVREPWLASLPTIDWDIVRRWMTAGADWAFVPEITVDYYR